MEKISIGMCCKEHLPYTLLAVKRLVECTVNKFELIIADDSKVSVEEAVRNVAPDLELKVLHEGGKRGGASEAMNDCFRNATNGVCITVENDVMVTPGWDVPLVKMIVERPEIGLLIPFANDLCFLGPTFFDSHVTFKTLMDKCVAFKRLRDHYSEDQGLERLMEIIDEAVGSPLNDFAKKYVEEKRGGELKDYQNTWVSYAVRMDVLKDVGGYDENYKMAGYEDLDLAKRLNMLGFRTVVTNESFVWHCGGVTRAAKLSPEESKIRDAVGAKSKEYFYKKFSNAELNPREHWVT